MLDLQEESRYDRQERITWWEQSRLQAARVLVVGAGALGNEVVKGLVLLGIGHVDIYDFDRIEPSNLARCVFFRAGDRGRLKAEVVAERAGELGPDSVVTGVSGDVRELGTARIASYDVVVGALDNREARLSINRACLRAGVPWVDGAIEGLQGLVRVFPGIDRPCYECTLHEADWQDIASRRACTLLTREEMAGGRAPTTATTSAFVAAFQVQEVVRLLHAEHLPEPLGGRALMLNGLTHDHYVTKYAMEESCTAHEVIDVAAAIDIDDALSLRALVDRASGSAGADATVELERERVVGWRCRCAAGTVDLDPLPLTRLAVGDAVCPACDLPRTPVLAGVIGPDQLEGRLGGLTIAELALPEDDLVSVHGIDGVARFRPRPAPRAGEATRA
jgi:adenylyltransferase/sulfurtransferase